MSLAPERPRAKNKTKNGPCKQLYVRNGKIPGLCAWKLFIIRARALLLEIPYKISSYATCLKLLGKEGLQTQRYFCQCVPYVANLFNPTRACFRVFAYPLNWAVGPFPILLLFSLPPPQWGNFHQVKCSTVHAYGPLQASPSLSLTIFHVI